ncbi:MAG: MrtC family glutamic-type intramembrane protease [Myxococcales bacterium]
MVKAAPYTESRGAIARELGISYLAVTLVTWVITHTPSGHADSIGTLLLSATFLFGALARARRDPRGAAHYGIDLDGVLEPRQDERDPGLFAALRAGLPSMARELGFALKLAALVFPPFVLAFALYHRVHQPFTFQPPAEPLDFVLGQLLVVALPEEALFRGYFQTRLADLFPPKGSLWGTPLSWPAWIGQAALFAVLHFIVGFSPARLAVFFPGLLFGYIRARRGGIGAAIWFHALSNGLSELLTRGWL